VRIYALHLNKPTEDGIHTVGFYTDPKLCERDMHAHNAEHHVDRWVHMWDYPANMLLSGDAGAEYFRPDGN
jgi:hypothetical protein